ncbi:MAG TPA: hypothetical protein VHH11_11470 [Gammaproteobacteria bacterium]|jgi:hypothetical protein|nr:hypothetical protein [Gammaproteobacteria bacterium]
MRHRATAFVSLWLGLTLVHATLAQPAKTTVSGMLRADAFPTADAIIQAYTNDAERLAALAVLYDLIESKTGPKTRVATARQTDYRRAIARLDPPRSVDPLRTAARKLRRDPAFQSAVRDRFFAAPAPDTTH